MPFAPEFLWPIITAILGIGIAWGVYRYKTRDKRLDPLTEQETKRVMDDPGPEPMKDDAPQPPLSRPYANR
jgi:hypothetical protein